MSDAADQAQAIAERTDPGNADLPIGLSRATRHDLLEQTYDSRERNVWQILARQLEMQLDIEANINDRLEPHGLGFGVPASAGFALTLGRCFPFLKSPAALIERSQTFADLVRLIIEKAGAV
jgi:hypothetical protein